MVHYLSKIIEKLLFNRLSSFFAKFNVIHNNQFGFLSGKSTSDALIKLIDFFYNVIDSNEYSIALFIDYQKAFDTIEHHILFSYSNKLSYNIDLPQGSTLAPLLFILYINDVQNTSSKFQTVLFADDFSVILLLFRSRNFRDLVETCNLELNKFKEWTNANKLSLNISKTFVIVVTNRNYPIDFNIKCGDWDVEICTEVIYLGVKLDHNLKFNSHCRHVSNKISKSTGILYKLSNYLPKNTLASIYYSLIYPLPDLL